MEEPLKIAICEDSASDEEILLNILKESPIPVIPTVFHSGEALLEHYTPMEYDLILTDIYMGGITGVETITRIRQVDEEVPVAFVTTSLDFALESYRLSALKYIEKPYQEKEIEAILALARMQRDSAPGLICQKAGKEEKIRFRDILYVEQVTHVLNVYRKDGTTVTLYEKMAAVLPQLEEYGFFAPHKSYCVNLAQVSAIDTELRCFVMAGGQNVPIRRESMSKAKKAWEAYLFREARGSGA